MHSPSKELAFALRSPGSGSLAAVVCALSDWLEDPHFNASQRDLILALVAQGVVPRALADQAAERLEQFATDLESLHAQWLTHAPTDEADIEGRRARLRVVGDR